MRISRLTTGLLVVGVGLIAGCDQLADQLLSDSNGAAALRWQGAVDLDVDFSEFFSSDHTIALWSMTQYPYGPAGPMIAENGTGTFMVGLGDYRWGDGGLNSPAEPVLFMRIGSEFEIYPTTVLYLPEQWAHVAVVRSGNSFTLYLNGVALSPSITYSGSAPTGNLRLGRRTDGKMHGAGGADYIAQFYGFIDEVAVFQEQEWPRLKVMDQKRPDEDGCRPAPGDAEG